MAYETRLPGVVPKEKPHPDGLQELEGVRCPTVSTCRSTTRDRINWSLSTVSQTAVDEGSSLMPSRFSPGAIDYDGRMSAHYPSGRGLSAQSAETWRAAVAPFIPIAQPSRVLDLASGTGRFATLFARSFPARIVGVEPSRGMLGVAVREGKARTRRVARRGSGRADHRDGHRHLRRLARKHLSPRRPP